MKALIITAEQFEDSELFVPKEALEKAGFQVDVATPGKGHQFHGKHGGTVLAEARQPAGFAGCTQWAVLPQR